MVRAGLPCLPRLIDLYGGQHVTKDVEARSVRATKTFLEAMMAVIFLLLAAVVGVALGDVVLSNTGSASIDLFNRSITDFTQGELLLIAAGLGFLFALFLFIAWGSSSNRRAKRRERRLVRRDLESRVDGLERENVGLRQELDRTTATSRQSDLGGEPLDREREPAYAMRHRDRAPGDGDGNVRDRLERGDRVEEPAKPDRA
jgi:hypothetical protein